MRNKIITFVLLIFCMQVSGFAQSGFSKTGMTAATFLSIEVGPRAAAMGGAYVAIADDPTAVQWNPAGLDRIYQQSVMLFHASLLEGALYDFIGYAYPTLDLGTFGIGLGRIGVDEYDVINSSNVKIGKGSMDLQMGSETSKLATSETPRRAQATTPMETVARPDTTPMEIFSTTDFSLTSSSISSLTCSIDSVILSFVRMASARTAASALST